MMPTLENKDYLLNKILITAGLGSGGIGLALTALSFYLAILLPVA